MRALLLSWLLFTPPWLFALQVKGQISAESAILINAESGRVLFEKNADKPQFPASITKIATAAYALQSCGDRLDRMIAAEQESIASISDEQMRRSGYSYPAFWLTHGTSHIGIKRGEELTLGDLLHGMLIASGGDASNVIAQYVGGSIPTFMQLLNEYIKSLGCRVTHFKNPHGLHHPQHVTTAREMGQIARVAMQHPTFRDIVKTVRCPRPKTNMQEATTLLQTNKLLRKGKWFYPKAIGIKTGFTSHAKNTLVAAAERNGRLLVAVLLKSEERDDLFRDAIALFESAFNEPYESKVLLKAGPLPYVHALEGASTHVATVAKKPLVVGWYPSEAPQLHSRIHWRKNLRAPIAKGERVGELTVEDDLGVLWGSVELFASDDVALHWKRRTLASFSSLPWGIFFALFSLIALGAFLAYELGSSKPGQRRKK